MKMPPKSPEPITMLRKHSLILVVAGMLAVSPAMAAKPDFAGGGNSRKNEQKNEQVDKRGHQSDRGKDHGGKAAHGGKGNDGVRVSVHFGDRHRSVVRDYYRKEFGRGRCPPGLAKKRNGCMPPGLAKKWAVGHRLPHDVIYYDLPRGLLIDLGAPPAGHKYVRVAADILLIAVGTGMVVDALADLNSL